MHCFQQQSTYFLVRRSVGWCVKEMPVLSHRDCGDMLKASASYLRIMPLRGFILTNSVYIFSLTCFILQNADSSPDNTDVMTPVYLVRFMCHLFSYYQVYLIWSHCSTCEVMELSVVT